MDAATKALLAELDAEFGKKPKAKARADGAKIAGTSTTQRNSTGGLSDFLQDSNAIARGFVGKAGWEPVARVTYIIHEKCRCCDGSVSYVGNEFTRFRNERQRAYVLSPELVMHDSLGFELEFTTDEWSHEVDRCARCLKADKLATALAEELDRPRTLLLNFGS